MRPIHVIFLVCSLFLSISAYSNFDKTEHRNIDSFELFGIPSAEWRCGTDESLSKPSAIWHINESCPLAAADFNHCCAVHEDCYINQKGKQFCDQQMIECGDRLVALNQEAKKCEKDVQVVGKYIKLGGSTKNYDNAPNWVNNEVQRFPEQLSDIRDEYLDLYQKCATQNVTISSCALKYDLCYRTLSRQNVDCSVDFIRCLDDTKAGREPNEPCEEAMSTVLSEMVAGGSLTVNVALKIVRVYFKLNNYINTSSPAAKSNWIFWISFASICWLCCLICLVCLIVANCRIKEEMAEDTPINVHIIASTVSTKSTSNSEISDTSSIGKL